MLGGSSAGSSETGVLDERGWDVKRGNSLGRALLEGARPECRRSVDSMWSVEIAWGELRWKERDCRTSVDGMWSVEMLGGSSAGSSETGVLDERGWDVKRGNSLGRALLEGARPECRRSVDSMWSVEIAWGEFGGRSESGVPDERGWGVKRGNSLGELRWKERDGNVKRGNSLGGALLEGARPECWTSVESEKDGGSRIVTVLCWRCVFSTATETKREPKLLTCSSTHAPMLSVMELTVPWWFSELKTKYFWVWYHCSFTGHSLCFSNHHFLERDGSPCGYVSKTPEWLGSTPSL